MSIARLLHNLVKKNQKWDWMKKQKKTKTFKELKKRFTKELVLAVPNLDKKMRIEVDMLDYAIGVSHPMFQLYLSQPIDSLLPLICTSQSFLV